MSGINWHEVDEVFQAARAQGWGGEDIAAVYKAVDVKP